MELNKYQKYYFAASWQYKSGNYYIAMNRRGQEKGRRSEIFPDLLLAVIQVRRYRKTNLGLKHIGWEVREVNGEYITAKRDLLPYPGEIIIK